MNSPLSEKQVDELVIAQADDDSAWEEPINVKTASHSTFELPSELAAKAAFFARLHKTSTVEEWITGILKERIAFEEAAFAELKHALNNRVGAAVL